MKIIFFLLPIVAISLIIPAYAEKGLNYDDVILASFPNGTQVNQWTSAPERILVNGQYSDFRFINGADFLSVETGHGSVKLNKDTCSFDFYKKGIIDDLPLFSDSIVVKMATNGTGNWNEINQIASAVCEASGNETQLVAKKFVGGVGLLEYKYINTGSTWKTQLEATNLSSLTNKKFGFTQTMDLNRDSIKFGNIERNLDDFSGQTFGRTFLENNQAKVLDLLNDITFDFDIGFDRLESVYVLDTGQNTSKISFNYLRNAVILLPNETLIIDPTFTGTETSSNRNYDNGGAGVACTGTFNANDNSLNILKRDSGSVIVGSCQATWLTFDVSSITGASSVTSASIEYDVTGTTNAINCDWVHLNLTPVGDQTTMDNLLKTGALYTVVVSNDATCQTTADGLNDVFSSASYTPILNDINGDDVVAIGFTYNDWVRDGSVHQTIIRDADAILSITYSTVSSPWAVTDLTNPSETTTTESLSWTAPYAGGGGQYIIGYQINQTTPWTSSPLVLVNDTGTTGTTYTAVGLTAGTDYSFRVSAWTNVTADHPLNNVTGNVLNVTTPLNIYGTVNPTGLDAIPVICNATAINLQWSSGLMDSINGYRIQRETPVGGGFSSLVGNTTNTLTFYNDTGLTANNNYNYRVYSLNQSGISAASNVDASYTCHLPNAVMDLTGTATDLQTIILTWTTPVAYSTILGYMVNFTTPEGDPITVFDPPHTGSTSLTETVYGLSIGLNYSFRVSPVTIFGSNSSGNIFNATTTTAFELGNLDLTDTENTDDFKIFYNRTNTNTTSILLDVTYPSSYTLTCNILHKFSRDNNTYTGLTETPITGPGADTDNVVSSFVFNGANTEVILVNCYDTSIPDAAKYIITVTDFALLDQIDNFRNGTYGTRGQIGGLDMIALIVVIIGMIGFNRVTPIVGVVFMAATTFTLAHFEIIEWYEIMYPALVLVILLAWVRTRQSD